MQGGRVKWPVHADRAFGYNSLLRWFIFAILKCINVMALLKYLCLRDCVLLLAVGVQVGGCSLAIRGHAPQARTSWGGVLYFAIKPRLFRAEVVLFTSFDCGCIPSRASRSRGPIAHRSRSDRAQIALRSRSDRAQIVLRSCSDRAQIVLRIAISPISNFKRDASAVQ